MSDLTSEVMSHLDASHIQAIAQQLGVDPAQAQTAVQQALPMIVGGLAHNASTAQGAQDLHNVLSSDHAGTDIGGLLGSVLGGGGGAAGSAILGHIFGANQAQAAQGLGQSTGLGAQNAGQLLTTLAPVVMGVLGNLSQNRGLNPGGLGGMLGQEAQSIQASPIGGVLSSVLGGQQQAGGLSGILGGVLGAFGKRNV